MRESELKEFLVSKNTFVTKAMEKIDNTTKGILYVVDDQKKLLGSLTDGDIRRWLIKTGDLSAKVSDIMNANPKVVYEKNIVEIEKMIRDYTLNSVPIVSYNNVILDIYFKENCLLKKGKKEKFLTNVPVVIMAGGKGTRLYPYTKILPKPLIPIKDIPIMERIIEKFKMYKINEFYVTVNYRKDMIKAYFSEKERNEGFHLLYIEEEKPLGTGGSLCLIPKKFDKAFFVTNCDILIHADYSDIYNFHLEEKNDLTVVTALKNIAIPYGVLHSKEHGIVTSLEEKPSVSYFVNTGMYILNPKVVEDVPENTFYHMTDLIKKLIERGAKVGMYPISENSFLDMGEFEEMNRMEKLLSLKTE